MGLLNGGIEAIFGSALAGLYLPATLHQAGAYATDDEGNVLPAADTEIPCRAQLDGATWAMRQSEGFVDGDMRIIVLSAGLGVEISTDDQITVSGKRWQIASAERDAAQSHWILLGRVA